MLSMLSTGRYDVLVGGQQAGYLRVTHHLVWFLGSHWRGSRPETFSVVRTGSAGTFNGWRDSLDGASVRFSVGSLAQRSGGVPRKARPRSGGLLALDRTRDDAYAFLQIDPGVVSVWKGASSSVIGRPTAGLGYAVGTVDVHTEVWVPLRGVANLDALTVKREVRADSAELAVRAFKRKAAVLDLDYDRGAAWSISEPTRKAEFWEAAGALG